MEYDHSNTNGQAFLSLLSVSKDQSPPPFLFKTSLSLLPLIKLWRQYETEANPSRAATAKQLLAALEKAPELAQPSLELATVEKHAALVEQLLIPVFPAAYWEDIYAAAAVPFQLRPFLASPGFNRLNLMGDHGFNAGMNLAPAQLLLGRNLNAYSHILRRFYGVETQFEFPLIFTSADAATGLARHYKVNIDLRFIEIKKVGETKPLAPEDIQRLLANPSRLEMWFELIPPQCFEFSGFAVFSAVDVTDQEVMSSLKNDLLEKNAVISPVRFQNLQNKLRALLRRPDVKLGLAGIPGAQNLLREHGRKIGHSFILNETCRYQCSSFTGSVYDHAMQHDEIVIVENLETYATPTPVEAEIIKQGVKNIFIAPLRYEDQLIGLLELGSPNPGDINAINSFKLREVLSLFAVAIKRSLDEMSGRVEAVIKEQCTAIHPAVEWRFRRAALNYLQHQQDGVVAEMEPVVFDEVYPLYGLSDVRGSSTRRNDAIRADLSEHLNLAREIILLAHRHKPLPYLAQLGYRLGRQLEKIEAGLGSGDEMSLLDFVRREIEPHFEQLQSFSGALREKIAAYRAALDPQLGFIYHKRKDFEASVMQLNEAISNYIDAEQEKAQAMFPHYFEKFKSDGVDYGVYIGASLVENGKFDRLYLRNIRLWQLMLMCGVARLVEQQKPRLNVPLEMAHLILVQNTPLAIRFRYDEKKFDVDGAYNVRYEIMKKRIDKAVIKGTKERLTQPGKIAIIYSQPREAAEYREYIEYLHASGELSGAIEDFELEDLQGLHGLKALRVKANLQTAAPETLESSATGKQLSREILLTPA